MRAQGPLEPIPFIDELGRALAPQDYGDIELAIDYILEPDADAVQQRFTFRSPRATPTPVMLPIVLSMQFSRMPAVTPLGGFDFDDSMPTDWLGFVDDDATSYAYQTDGPLEVLLQVSGTVVLKVPPYRIEACSQTTVEMGRFDVGGPGLDGLRSAMARTDGETQRTITGTVYENDGTTPAPGVRVHADLADGTYYTRTTSGEDGTFTLHVPEEDVNLTAFRRGQPMVGPTAVAAATDTADITMGPVGTLEINARDMVSGESLPARIQVLPSPAIDAPPNRFGERKLRTGRTHIVSPADGHASLLVGAGMQTVVVSRGYEYEVVSVDVMVGEGETVNVDAALARVVDTTDVMCADFHIHTHRSLDSADTGTFKVLALVADGLEIPIRTDHELVNDFQPVDRVALASPTSLRLSGMELTTFTYGHFGVFPLVPELALPSGRRLLRWYDRPRARGLRRRARRGPRTPALIINHPRAAGPPATSSRPVRPRTGMVSRPDSGTTVLLVEVFNDSSFDENYDPTGGTDSTVMDWFSLLNSGRRVFTVGSSDSHRITSSPVGYPRTCVQLGTDEPATLRAMGATVVRDQVRDGHVTVSGGIYVDALARGDVGPGGDVMGAMDRETVSVRVQAANWIDANRLRVFVDGVMTETITLDETTRDPMEPTTRLSQDIEISVAPAGSWVVFVADGTDDLAPVHPTRLPFGVTNPIFFNR